MGVLGAYKLYLCSELIACCVGINVSPIGQEKLLAGHNVKGLHFVLWTL